VASIDQAGEQAEVKSDKSLQSSVNDIQQKLEVVHYTLLYSSNENCFVLFYLKITRSTSEHLAILGANPKICNPEATVCIKIKLDRILENHPYGCM